LVPNAARPHITPSNSTPRRATPTALVLGLRLLGFLGFLGLTLVPATSCGPSIRLYPLVNEDPALVEAYTWRAKTKDSDDGDLRCVAAFYEACLKDDIDAVWGFLDTDAQALLDNLGKVSESDGRGLLAGKRWPSLLDNRITIEASALQLFFFEGKVTFERDPDKARDHFLAISEANRFKPIRLVRKDGACRVAVDEFARLMP
jgi:hypothetical protein